MPGSTLVNPEHTVIIREGSMIDPSSVRKNSFTLYGLKSGDHSFRTVFSRDQKTIILYPDHPFAYDETVSVTINSGLRAQSGSAISPFSFTFSTHREYTETERAQFKEWNEIATNEGIVPVNTQSERHHGQADRPLTGSYTILNDSNPTPGDIFYDAWNAAFTGSTNYDGYNIITPQGDSVYSSGKASQAFGFTVNPDGYLSVFNNSLGRFDILDSNYTVIDSYYPGNGYESDPHEFVRLSDGHAFMVARESHIVDMTHYGGPSNATVMTTIVQEFDQDKNVIFEWRAWDHIGLTETNQSLTSSYIDLVHTNSIDVDTDGNIIISNRHLDQVDKIDVNTGNFIWRLGGVMNQFTFVNEPEPFSFQHDCRRIANGDITLWDNGNGHIPTHSMAKEYQLDEVNKTATLVWSWQPKTYSGDNAFYLAMGSVQRLPNGNTMINGGWDNSSNESNFWEVTPDGTIVWELALNNSTDLVSYRALKFNWTPCAPLNSASLKARNITSSSAKIFWKKINNESSYDIQYRRIGETSWRMRSSNDDNKNLDHLAPNTIYQYQVRANCANGFTSDWSSIKRFKTSELRLTNEAENFSVLQLHPNPSDGLVNIDINLDQDQVIGFLVYDLSGKVVFNTTETAFAGDQSLQFDLTKLPAGVYTAQVKTISNNLTMKFVKQ